MSTPQQSPAPVVASAPPAASSLPELPATSVPVPALGEAAFPTTTPILPVAPFMGGAPGIPPLNLTGDAAVSQPIMSMPASGVMPAFPFTFSIPGAPSFINNVPQARDEKDYDEQPRKYARTSGAGSANRKPHLQGRFSGRLETKEDEKRLVSECILLNALIGGETRGGDPNSNSLTWAELAQQADFSLTWNGMFPDPHRQQSNDAMVGGTRNTLAKIVRAMSGNEVRQYLATEFNNYVDLLAKKPLADYVEKVSTENRQLRVKLEECFAALRKANVATPSAPGPATPVPNPTLYPKLSSPPGPLPVIESGKGSSPFPSQGLSSTSPANLAAGFPIPSAPSIPVTPVDLSSLPMFSSPLAGWPNGTVTPPAGMMSMPPTAGLPGVLPSIPLPNMPAMPTMPALTMPGGTNPFPLPTTLLPPTSTTTNTPAEEAKPATEPAAAPKTE